MNTTTTTAPVPGDRIHLLVDSLFMHRQVFAPDDVAAMTARPYESSRGDVVVVSEGLLDANPWIAETIDSPEEQIRRFGVVRVGRGDFPSTEPRWIRGAADTELEIVRRREIAKVEPDEHKREQMLQDIRRELGSIPSSRTIADYAGDGGQRPSRAL